MYIAISKKYINIVFRDAVTITVILKDIPAIIAELPQETYIFLDMVIVSEVRYDVYVN